MESEIHREIAVQAFNRCWEILDADERDDELDQELLTAAFASRYHWQQVDDSDEQTIVADWMIARCAATLGDGDLSLIYAQRAYDGCEGFDVSEWLPASVCEGLARAYASLGDRFERDRWYSASEGLVERIVNDDDRALIAEQLASVPEPAQ